MTVHFTKSDNWLKKCLEEQVWGQDILVQLGVRDINQLFEQLKQVHKQSQSDKVHVIAQYQTHQNTLAYLFSPLISALLGFKASYITTKTDFSAETLSNYFNLNALDISKEVSLLEMGLSFDLVEKNTERLYFEIYSVLNAVLQPNVGQFSMIDGQNPEVMALAEQYALKTQAIVGIQSPLEMKVDYKTLFWKRKTEQNAVICQKITTTNTALFAHLNHFKPTDLERLIDDFMYGEHLFEKISVFGEFTETILKNHLEKIKKAC